VGTPRLAPAVRAGGAADGRPVRDAQTSSPERTAACQAGMDSM